MIQHKCSWVYLSIRHIVCAVSNLTHLLLIYVDHFLFMLFPIFLALILIVFSFPPCLYTSVQHGKFFYLKVFLEIELTLFIFNSTLS